MLSTRVELRVPIHPKKVHLNISRTDHRNENITSISIINFHQNQFKYDATWFTKQFHTLDAVWAKQNGMIQNRISTIVRNAFSDALDKFPINTWMTKKFVSLQEQIDSAINQSTNITSNNMNSTTIPSNISNNYNIDSGLLGD